MSDISNDDYWREQLWLNRRLVDQASDNQRRWSVQAEFNERTTRVAEEVIAHRGLLGQLRSGVREALNRLYLLQARVDEHGQRLDAHAEMIGQQGQQICDLQDSRVASNRRITELEREQRNSQGNPVVTLAIGAIALIGWLVLSTWLRGQVAGTKVWLNGQEIFWRDHPGFGDTAGNIIGGGVAFIIGMTIVCLIVDLVTRGRHRSQLPPPPPVVEADEPDENLAQAPDGDEPPGAQVQPPTQVMGEPVRAG